MKKIITITTITLLSLFLLTGCDKKEEIVVDTTKSNTNEGVIKDQEIDGLTFTKTSLIIKESGSVLVTTVTNTTTETKTVKTFTITVKDSDGNVMVTMDGYIGGEIKQAETKTIESTTEMDLTNASSIEYTINK